MSAEQTVSVATDRDIRDFGPTHRVVTIGRGEPNDVQVDHDLVSRFHCELRFTPEEGWRLVDVGSRNGTLAAGRPLDSVLIRDRTVVALGGGDGPKITIDLTDAAPERVDEVGAKLGTHLVADEEVVTIGRDPANRIVVDDLMVSRRHAELRTGSDGSRVLVDLASHNGTYVNGARITRAAVRDHDLLTVGSHLFRVTTSGLEEYVDDGAVVFHASDIVVRRGRKTIVDRVSISLDERSFMAIVGPSGAGKSTFATALAGLRRPAGGTVLYGGLDLHDNYDALKHRIGFVPQDDILHPELTVERALSYAARLRFPPDVRRRERRQRVEEVMAELDLGARRNLRVSQLSGGQRKRVSVALELLTKPSLLILDEPTSGLDPGTERQVMRLLRELADSGHTIMVVTHHLESLTECDRVLYLAPGGRQAYFGPPQLALAYFGEPDQPEVFQLLSSDDEADWPTRYASHPDGRRFLDQVDAVEQMAGVGTIRAPRGRLRQLAVLTSRNARVLFADWRTALLVLLQGPLLGLLLYLAMEADQLDAAAPLRLSSAMVTVLLLVVGATWIGLSNSIREIVKERAVYSREVAVGLSPTAYLASKVVLLAVITAVQTAAMATIAIQGQGGPAEGQVLANGRLELVLVAIAAGVASLSFGLLCSALVRSSDQAVLLLPALLVPLLVLAIPDVNDEPGLSQARVVAPSNWAFQSAAVTVDLNRLQILNEIARDFDDPVVRRAGEDILAGDIDRLSRRVDTYLESNGDDRFRSTDANFWTGIAGLGAITVVALLGARAALSPRRHRS